MVNLSSYFMDSPDSHRGNDGKRYIQQRAFEIVWRVTMFVLPWQMRWFRDAQLAGWPWEQGRLSVYASWFFICATLWIGSHVVKRQLSQERWKEVALLLAELVFASAVSIFFVTGDVWVHVMAMFQWWIQVVLLSSFALMLWKVEIRSRMIASMFVLSLLPFVALAFVQSLTQVVIGSKWFGIASHVVVERGTSVVELMGVRTLRVYAGFPHPNIFGGWLALGCVIACLLARRSTKKGEIAVWSSAAALFSIALVLTFARTAWIAFVVGIVTLFVMWIRHWKRNVNGLIAIACVAFSILVTGLWNAPLIVGRVSVNDRLEQKSISAREGSLRLGLDMIRSAPLFGTGPNAELLTIAPASGVSSEPLEPPHSSYLLALVDVGLFGAIVIALYLHKHREVWRAHLFHPVVLAIFILALLDHYAWSTWSGQVLVVLSLLTIDAGDIL